jgi:transcriptional regulator with XRE-family HTH domain
VVRGGRDAAEVGLFGAELAAARIAAGLSQDELGDQVSYSGSMIGMVENGHRIATRELAIAFDRVFGTPGTFERLQQYVRTVPLPAWFRPWAEIEEMAVQLRLYEHSLVPGLFQTEEYARAVLSEEPNTSEDQVAELVVARLARQAVLTRAGGPPIVWAVIDEAVLDRPVGGVKVMHEQLLYLLHLAEQPNITVQGMPRVSGAHCCLVGAFAVADHDGTSAVYLDTVTDGYIADSPGVAARVTLKFESLRSEALTRTASRELILRRAEDYGPD